MQSIVYMYVMYAGPVFDTIKNFVDRIFKSPKAILDLARQKLISANQVTARGLNFQAFLNPLGDLPGEWQRVVSSILIGLVVILGLLSFRGLMRMYYALKDGIRWW